MKAIGFRKSLPISEAESFLEFETETPVPSDRDLLVRIRAISVNPIDYKIRKTAAQEKALDHPKIIGWDAAGIVEAVGSSVSKFQVGDEVFYAGDLTRPGCNAEYQLVDERIVGHKPNSVSMSEAAALPLTALTAWESIFDRARIGDADRGKYVLILAGAGGVGSIAIQIAKQVAGLKVIATASREESAKWCRQMGADHVVNHYNLEAELETLGFKEIDYILDFVNLNQYWEAIVKLIKPQGHIVSITGSDEPLNLSLLKKKSVSFSWELMYTRSMYTTPDMQRQHEILNELSKLIDSGQLKTTCTSLLEGFTVSNLKRAHEMQESGSVIGKTVIHF